MTMQYLVNNNSSSAHGRPHFGDRSGDRSVSLRGV